MQKVNDFFKELISNRVSQLLVIAHFVYVTAVYLFLPRQFGFAYHASEEPAYYQILMLVDYPSILLVGVLYSQAFSRGLLQEPFWLSAYYLSLILATTLQWLLIGYVVVRAWRSTWPDKVVEADAKR